MSNWLLTVIISSILFPTPNPHITRENYDRIEGGMKLREVETLLGGKAGDYRTVPTCSCLRGYFIVAVEDESITHLRWEGDEAEIEVWVDRNGKTCSTGYTLMCPTKMGIVRTLLWRCQHWRRVNFCCLSAFFVRARAFRK